MKTDQELIAKKDEIIDSLEGFSIAEKYVIIRALYFGFMDACRMKGYMTKLFTKDGEELDR
jgi:hypothetical protein